VRRQTLEEAIMHGLGKKEGLVPINDGRARRLAGLNQLAQREARRHRPKRALFKPGEAARIVNAKEMEEHSRALQEAADDLIAGGS
jgi:hypothetical protein